MQYASALFLALVAPTVPASSGLSRSKTALGVAMVTAFGATKPRRTKLARVLLKLLAADSVKGSGSGNGSAKATRGGAKAAGESDIASPTERSRGFGEKASKTTEAGSAKGAEAGNTEKGATPASDKGAISTSMICGASATSTSPAIFTGGAASLSNSGGTIAVAGLSVAFAVFM
ncbi:hypothetical protein DSL72_003561 [Monilinia vaccinii-corymbosi]|uniref:Uncharacterized protein n=1 Tax=Monilinia vaccinii-corymbosi TaxID=61207 RepID=A0A8A3P2N6_9HELO|nr:hypothetical protein DSL72_003561 [Monilinia vaccinii-corymbosi]